MPFVELKPKIISPRNYFGNNKGISGATVVNTVKEQVSNLEAENIGTKLKLLRMVKAIVEIMFILLRDGTRLLSVFIDPVLPNIGINSWEILPYSQIHANTERYNIKSYKYVSIKRGGYHVNAAYCLIMDAVNYITYDSAEIAIFKNGTLYKVLDRKSYSGQPEYVAWWTGTALVYMEDQDYIDIRFRHQSADSIRLENSNSPYGYFDVHYSGCNTTVTNLI